MCPQAMKDQEILGNDWALQGHVTRSMLLNRRRKILPAARESDHLLKVLTDFILCQTDGSRVEEKDVKKKRYFEDPSAQQNGMVTGQESDIVLAPDHGQDLVQEDQLPTQVDNHTVIPHHLLQLPITTLPNQKKSPPAQQECHAEVEKEAQICQTIIEDEVFLICTLEWELPTSSSSAPERLDSTNKGYQMMQKMGWKGSGENGITEPISGR